MGIEECAKTRAEAEQQSFILPPHFNQNWVYFASLIDGYAITEEMGIEWRTWYQEQHDHYRQTSTWDLDILGLRLMLFFEYRADHFSGVEDMNRDIVESLLKAFSQHCGQPYESE